MTPYWIHLKRAHAPRSRPRGRLRARAPGGIIDNADDLRSARGDGYPGRDDVDTTTRVGEVQRLLTSNYGARSLEADGVFGPLTEQAVKAFQVANLLSPTGIVDTATSNALQDSDSVAIGQKRTTPPATSSKTGLVVAAAIGGLLLVGGGIAAHKAHKQRKAA